MTFTYLFSQVKYFITWYRKFTLCKASKNATNSVETETSKRTWDMWQKDFDPSLHKNMSPFWWTKKRGFFLPPSLLYGPMSPSQQFFFWRHPLGAKFALLPSWWFVDLIWWWLTLEHASVAYIPKTEHTPRVGLAFLLYLPKPHKICRLREMH